MYEIFQNTLDFRFCSGTESSHSALDPIQIDLNWADSVSNLELVVADT